MIFLERSEVILRPLDVGTRQVRLAARLSALGLAVAVAIFMTGCSSGHRRTAPSSVASSISSTTSSLPPLPGATTTVVAVPDVVGQVFQTAEGTLASANLVSQYRLEHTATVTAGSVIAQSPAPGSVVPSETTVTTVVSIGPSSIPGAKPCLAADLTGQPGPPVSEATGQHTRDFSLLNIGRPCLLNGYPAVEALDNQGRVLGYSYSHSGDQMTTGEAPQPVYLPHGSAAWIRLNKYRCDIGIDDTASMLKLTLPSSGGTLDLPFSLDYCSQSPSLTIAVSPFEPVEMLVNPSP